MKKNNIKEPLLYIAQPKLAPSQRQMQEAYYVRKDQQAKHELSEAIAGKSFKQLTLEEKINYLLTLPANIIDMKCKFSTDRKTYFGRIIQKEDDQIEVVHSGSQRVRLKISDIKEIELASL